MGYCLRMNGLLSIARYIFVLCWLWTITCASELEPNSETDHDLQRLEQRVANLTKRMLQLEQTTEAISSRRMVELEQKVINLTTRLQILEKKYNNVSATMTSQPQTEQFPIHNINSVPLRNCKRILDEDGNAPSGLYQISPCGMEFTVYCDMESNGGGWTVIQQRVDNSTDFYRRWEDYREGFGNFKSNMWLGLDKMHCLTDVEQCELLVTISSFSDETAKSHYNHFKVGSKDSGYRLQVKGYNHATSNGGDALEIHSGQKFTTQDQDNDMSKDENCAVKYRSAWWYNQCGFESNLNGQYYYEGTTTSSNGIVWRQFTGSMYSAKKVTMALR